MLDDKIPHFRTCFIEAEIDTCPQVQEYGFTLHLPEYNVLAHSKNVSQAAVLGFGARFHNTLPKAEVLSSPQ